MDFYGLFGRFGGDCSIEKGHAFWSKSVDSYAFLGFLGEGAALKKGVHFEAKVWISMLFLEWGGFAEWKKGMHFGAQVWISIPFLGLSGGLRRGKRAWSAGGVFLVSEGFEAYVGPMLGHKNSKHKKKKKCWEFMFGHFEALVLSPNRRVFPLEVDFGGSWAMFRPILGHFGASRRPAGPQFELRRKESLRLGSNRVFWATISCFVGIQTLYWGDVGPFWYAGFFGGAFVIILGFSEPSWAMLERHLWVVRSHVGPVLVVLSFCCSVLSFNSFSHSFLLRNLPIPFRIQNILTYKHFTLYLYSHSHIKLLHPIIHSPVCQKGGLGAHHESGAAGFCSLFCKKIH